MLNIFCKLNSNTTVSQIYSYTRGLDAHKEKRMDSREK